MSHANAARLSGLLTAIQTPFDLEGNLALEAMPRLIWHQARPGIDGLVVCGTNGEGQSLSVAERKEVLERTLAIRANPPQDPAFAADTAATERFRDCAARMVIVAGTGAASLTDAQELTRHAAQAGADAALIAPPFFFKNPTAQGLANYFRPLLDAAVLPVLLYNIPQQTGVVITDELLALLGEHPNLAGIKDSTGDWNSTRHFITAYPHLRIFGGSDRLAAQCYREGGAGSISGGANGFPDVVAAVNLAHQADPTGEQALQAQARLNALLDITGRYPFIVVNKSILARTLNLRVGARTPLVNMGAAQEQELYAELAAAGFLAQLSADGG